MKPAVVTFYNSAKGGVDVVDGMKGKYTIARVALYMKEVSQNLSP